MKIMKTSLHTSKDTPMQKKLLSLVAVVLLSFFSLVAPSAHAAYIATLSEVGSDVVGTGDGSLDITALLFSSTGTHEALINPVLDIAAFGPTADTPTDLYRFTSGPSSFGPGPGGFPDLGEAVLWGSLAAVCNCTCPPTTTRETLSAAPTPGATRPLPAWE
jgi:hypothetical protein